MHRQAPVHRESIGVNVALDMARPYLLQTQAPVNYVFTDASSLSYTARVKPFNGFLQELAVTLSTYPSLAICHVPGWVLFIPDILSRQNDQITIPHTDTQLSKDQSVILPPLQNLPPETIISNNQLFEIMYTMPKKVFFDVSESSYFYCQHIDWDMYHKPDQIWRSEN